MRECLLILVFLNIVAFVSIKLFKKIFDQDSSASDADYKVKTLGSEAIPEQPQFSRTGEEMIPDESVFFPETPAPAKYRATSAKDNFYRALLFIFAISFLVFTNFDRLQSLVFPPKQAAQTNTEIDSLAGVPTGVNITAQTKVDGVYWYKVEGYQDDGEKVSGWFTEFALKPEPAKESKGIDSISQKLGLPTTEERVTYIKKLKKINSALKTALDNNKPAPEPKNN